MEENGVDVKMVTGDNRFVGPRSFPRNLVSPEALSKKTILGKWSGAASRPAWWKGVFCGFSEVLPEDKYHIVEEAKKYFTVASKPATA